MCAYLADKQAASSPSIVCIERSEGERSRRSVWLHSGYAFAVVCLAIRSNVPVSKEVSLVTLDVCHGDVRECASRTVGNRQLHEIIGAVIREERCCGDVEPALRRKLLSEQLRAKWTDVDIDTSVISAQQ